MPPTEAPTDSKGIARRMQNANSPKKTAMTAAQCAQGTHGARRAYTPDSRLDTGASQTVMNPSAIGAPTKKLILSELLLLREELPKIIRVTTPNARAAT